MLLPTLKQHIHTHTHPEEELIQYSLFFYSFVCLLCLFLFRKTLQYHRKHTHTDTHINTYEMPLSCFVRKIPLNYGKRQQNQQEKVEFNCKNGVHAILFFCESVTKRYSFHQEFNKINTLKEFSLVFFYSNKKESNIHSICIINKNSSRL